MILFIGNFLTSHGYNPTFIEILANKLNRKYNVNYISDKKNKIIRLLDMVLKFYRFINKTKLVVIDTYSTSAFYYALIMAIICKIHGKPYILVLSGGNLAKRLNSSIFFRTILNSSVQNISPSKYLQKVFKTYNAIYIPNFLDLSMYQFQNRQVIKPNLLWVRSIHKIYNPEMAILVLNEIVKRYPQAKLCMVGPPKDAILKKVLNLIKRLNLENQVILTGKLKKEDWIKLSTNYDIFINTTNFDNHPISILEAMALGIPIVSTNVGGIPDMLIPDYNGKLVAPNDVDAMAKEITAYLDDNNKANQVAINARKEIEENYNEEIIINKWYKIINNINCKNSLIACIVFSCII